MLALLRCFTIVAFSSFWSTILYVLCIQTAATCSSSGLHVMNGVSPCIYIYIYIYIYICSSVCAQECLSQYIHICRPYIYIGPCKYILTIYICFLCPFTCLHAYFLLYICKCISNVCKYMLHCTSNKLLHSRYKLSISLTLCQLQY